MVTAGGSTLQTPALCTPPRHASLSVALHLINWLMLCQFVLLTDWHGQLIYQQHPVRGCLCTAA